jgi:predicted PhzF superfamily epimerase YddE/YHI9
MAEKHLLLGDEALALGALHAGLSGVYAYPGTPSTEITEFIQNHPLTRERNIHCDWSSNEKTAMEEALGTRPVEAWMARDLLCVMDSAATVRELQPDQQAIEAFDGLLLVHVTAAGEEGSGYDCVSRSFAPKLAIPEDPVCGSGHCHIMPYWAERLGKQDLVAYQASRRGGTLWGRVAGDGRCVLAGKAARFSVAALAA